MCRLTAEDMRRLVGDDRVKDYVQLVEQKHGDVVEVNPGWAHAVINVKPCLKLAYDRLIQKDMPLCALIHHLLHSKLFYNMNAPDYSGAICFQFQELCNVDI